MCLCRNKEGRVVIKADEIGSSTACREALKLSVTTMVVAVSSCFSRMLISDASRPQSLSHMCEGAKRR
jgi:hypothetical protein